MCDIIRLQRGIVCGIVVVVVGRYIELMREETRREEKRHRPLECAHSSFCFLSPSHSLDATQQGSCHSLYQDNAGAARQSSSSSLLNNEYCLSTRRDVQTSIAPAPLWRRPWSIVPCADCFRRCRMKDDLQFSLIAARFVGCCWFVFVDLI